jgi:beta-lactamase regulating signal transducer with metallopeptidase domain
VGYYFLLAVLTLATYFGVVAASAVCLQLAWPRVKRPIDRLVPRTRARTLFVLRALPACAGGVAAFLCSASFLIFEPPRTVERPGLLLIAATAGALCLVIVAVARTARAWARSLTCSRLVHHCDRRCLDSRSVFVVDTAYPLAAVTGVFRTRIVVSGSLLANCTPGEIEAIVAHEASHVSRCDNLARATMLLLPDLLLILPAGRQIEHAWSAAAEEAADDNAAAGIPERRLALASALIRVAGLALTPAPTWMPDLAFFQGDNLERRVTRLLDPAPVEARSFGVLASCAVASGLLVLSAIALQSAAFHDVMEWAIRILP